MQQTLNNLESLQYISETYADGIGVWKNSILPRTSIHKNSKISTKLTGEITSFVENAHQAGLLVHCYTLRPEEEYLTLNTDEKVKTMREEIEQLMKIGVDGFFCDDPATCLQQVTINY
ncbi:glycerophosphodiester phosphodiesterase family protein [Crocosphaera watsonii]|uniref:glycerophosphodiester phosphodiesterase family protein n=1 Tax=Crocosphaera watsonii TaxID=263511 RepID=UPI002E0EC8DE|nr:glycerophosphodiester phosphodiesterase family protein [Crocosphaera watsonii]